MKFKMPIGDWSEDGHGKCDWYICETVLTLDDVREAHYKIEEKFDIHNICCGYCEDSFDKEVAEELKKLGFWHDDIDEWEGKFSPSSRTMIELWVFLLNLVNPELKIDIIDDEIPTLSFYGFDEKGRHINFVGYGVFS